MTQKLITIGNSRGIIIPKELLDELGFTADEKFAVEADKTTQSLIISKEGNKKQLTVSPHFFTILEKVNKEYGPALKKLAEL